MKNYFLFLAIIMLFTNCQKRETAIVQENTENSSLTTVEASADDDDLISLPLSGIMIQPARDTIIRPIQMEGKTIQETIENVYYIYYITVEFDERNDADTGLVELTNLGRAITYKDRMIGRVADFNGNGIDELYLYARSGRNIEPDFFEFNGTEFVEIIKLVSPDSAPIISIDPIEQVITLSIRNYRDGQDINLIEEINSYRWDDTVHQYEEFTSESKYYRWNRTLKEYEEIE